MTPLPFEVARQQPVIGADPGAGVADGVAIGVEHHAGFQRRDLQAVAVEVEDQRVLGDPAYGLDEGVGGGAEGVRDGGGGVGVGPVGGE
jgi:hypothetical protein